MTLQVQMRDCQMQINALREQKDTKKQELAKLKNENTLRLEKIEWNKEKVKKIQRERHNLKVQLQNSEKRSIPQGKVEKTDEQKQKKANEQLGEISDMQMLDFMNGYLDNVNKQLDKYSSFKKQDNQESDYINPYPVINMKHTISGVGDARSSIFRLDSNTDFRMLKELAFYYWNLDAYLVDENQSERDALDSLELSDESYAHIELKDKVIEFYQQRGIANIAQVTLLLQVKNTKKEQLNNLQLDNIKIQGNQKAQVSNLQQFMANKAKIVRTETYKKFFSKFPGLKYYISEDQIIEDEKAMVKELMTEHNTNDQAFELDDMNCLIISILVVILSVTISSYNFYLSPDVVSKNITFLQNLIDLKKGQLYQNITTIDSVFMYLEESIGKRMYISESERNPFRENYELIGGVQLRQLRVPISKCEKYVQIQQQESCFNPIYEIGNYTTHNSYEYQTAEQLNISYSMSGNLTTYKDGGFVHTFKRDITYEEFQMNINNLKKDMFLDQQTAAIFIHFLIYAPYNNIWIQGNLLIERNANNVLSPYKPILEAFVPNIYSGDQGQQLFTNDMVRLIFACLVLAFVAYRTYMNKQHQTLLKALAYLFIELGAFNLGVGIFTVLQVATTITQSAKGRDPQELVNSDYFVNLQEEAYLYNTSKTYISLVLMFVFLRLSYVLKLNDRISIIFLTYSNAFKELFAFLAIQFPVFIGFTLVFQVIYGNDLSQYTQFPTAIAAQLSLIQGQFSLTEFSRKQPIISLIAILLYYLFMLFFIISLFQAILIECYRTVIMKLGYPQDKAADWTMKDIFVWVFSWTALFKSKKKVEGDVKADATLPVATNQIINNQ